MSVRLSWLNHSYRTNIAFCFLTQVCCYCLWLCELPKADLWEGRLPDWVLLPLQANMASKSDMRYGPSAEGADFASTDQAHFRSQLWARIWTRYKLALFSFNSLFYTSLREPKAGRDYITVQPSISWDQRLETIWQYCQYYHWYI